MFYKSVVLNFCENLKNQRRLRQNTGIATVVPYWHAVYRFFSAFPDFVSAFQSRTTKKSTGTRNFCVIADRNAETKPKIKKKFKIDGPIWISCRHCNFLHFFFYFQLDSAFRFMQFNTKKKNLAFSPK